MWSWRYPFRVWLQSRASWLSFRKSYSALSYSALTLHHPGAKLNLHFTHLCTSINEWGEQSLREKQSDNREALPGWNTDAGVCAREGKGWEWTVPALQPPTKRGCCWITTEISSLFFSPWCITVEVVAVWSLCGFRLKKAFFITGSEQKWGWFSSKGQK